MRTIYKNNLLLFALLLPLAGCKKLVDAGFPTTSLTSDAVYNTNATAIAVLTGVYTSLSNAGSSTNSMLSSSLICGLSADELSMQVGGASNFGLQLAAYQDAAAPAYLTCPDFWSCMYQQIYVANDVIQEAPGAASLTPAVKQQMLGEAKFLRALFYFFVVNLHGDCPLVTGTDYAVNGQLARTPKDQIWQQIIQDLKDAQGLLSTHYLDGTLLATTSEKVRPTQWAATALLARAYLYTGDWADAETQASAVIDGGGGYSLDSLNGVFLKNNPEAIWQLQPVLSGQNAPDAPLFVLPSTGPDAGFPFFINPLLMNSFEPGDQRRRDWTDSVIAQGVTYYYPYKYKVYINPSPVTEYSTVLRLAELYLIRAEARARIGTNLIGAAADVNRIRVRAGLSPTTAATSGDLLAAVMQERRVEFFAELGHRWMDLKRTGAVDSVMKIATPLKGGQWDTHQQLYPIPQNEVQADPHIKQNPGY